MSSDNIKVQPNCDYRLCVISNVNLSNAAYDMPSYITSIRFENCTVNNFPSQIFQTQFNNYESVDLSYSKLQMMKNGDFKNARSLTKLDISYNNLTILDSDVFKGAERLKILNCSHNSIKMIEDSAFKDTKTLQNLNLAHNQIMALNENTFQHLSELMNLDLSYNLLQAIQSKIFVNNYFIEHLDLSNNNLLVIQDGSFEQFHRLSSIDISSNQLKHFSTENSQIDIIICDNCTDMTIYFSQFTDTFIGHNISNINFTYQNAELIRIMRITASQLTNLHFLKELTKLLDLDLSFSRIDNYTIHDFAYLESLINLRLVDTKLPNIDYGPITHLKRLRVLDISYNNLKQINMEMLSAMRLNELYIDGNNLTEIGDVIKAVPSLRTIGLTDNVWNCSFLIKFIATLETNGIEIFIGDGKRVRDSTNVHGIFCINDKKDLNNLPKIQPIEHDNISHDILQTNQIKDDIQDLKKQFQVLEHRMKIVIDQMVQLRTPSSTSGFLYTSMSVLIYFLIIILIVTTIFGVYKYGRNYFMRRRGFGSVSELHSISVPSL